MTAPLPPDYPAGTLATVLPSVLTSLGSTRYAAGPVLALPPARRAVVVLVDGLGDELVRRRRGHAPFMRQALATQDPQTAQVHRLTCGFPSTTATSMGTFGTGLPPGAHGLVGYEVLDPHTDRVLNELSWEGGPDPALWQPSPTVFEAAETDGVRVTRIGPGYFDGSGLTQAALRGGRFTAAETLDARIEAALEAVRREPRALVYVYWGDLDKVGHVYGAQSLEWGDELERIDRALARLVDEAPRDTSVSVTADHGMIDVPFEERIDLAWEPDLLADVRHVAGEARSVQLHCRPGAVADIAARWADRLGSRATVVHRDQAVAQGWFGPVRPHVLARIGDLVVNCGPDLAIVDSVRMRRQLLDLVGLHGSVTDAETAIPLFHWPAPIA